eukprot:6189296-Pleurochrysis_carterae.AAC.6
MLSHVYTRTHIKTRTHRHAHICTHLRFDPPQLSSLLQVSSDESTRLRAEVRALVAALAAVESENRFASQITSTVTTAAATNLGGADTPTGAGAGPDDDDDDVADADADDDADADTHAVLLSSPASSDLSTISALRSELASTKRQLSQKQLELSLQIATAARLADVLRNHADINDKADAVPCTNATYPLHPTDCTRTTYASTSDTTHASRTPCTLSTKIASSASPSCATRAENAQACVSPPRDWAGDRMQQLENLLAGEHHMFTHSQAVICVRACACARARARVCVRVCACACVRA